MAMPAIRVKSLSDTMFDFQRLVLPKITSWCGNGEFKVIEGQAGDSLAEDFDVWAGIDVIQKMSDLGAIRGIASRIQWGRDYSTFSIRASRSTGTKTELEKRTVALAHLDKGCLFPHITVQAYISQRRVGFLRSVAIAYTQELIAYTNKMGKGINKHSVTDDDGSVSTFLSVDWDAYKQAGMSIKKWRQS
ncbi:MAG: hypothetical protein ABI324_18640 [Ktedonobacteraceae bacterium]